MSEPPKFVQVWQNQWMPERELKRLESHGANLLTEPRLKKMLDKGTSNIILVNLLTGARTRVTTMHAGQYALYPHFRSDGWFYFQVRDSNTGKEYVLASDAALTNP